MISVVVAPACAMCDALLDTPTAGPVCGPCWSAIRPITPPLCSVCGDPLAPGADSADTITCSLCRGAKSLVARSRAIGEYAGALRAAVHLLKYDKRRSIAPRLAAMMVAAGRDVLTGADAAVPVPLHWRRKWQRGFNQASLLAAHLGLEVWPALARVRVTTPQVDLTASARRVNVRGAFALARRRWPWRPSWRVTLGGKIVVLVDDVATTGATVQACAEVLIEAGAREVRTLTAARVTRSGHHFAADFTSADRADQLH